MSHNEFCNSTDYAGCSKGTSKVDAEACSERSTSVNFDAFRQQPTSRDGESICTDLSRIATVKRGILKSSLPADLWNSKPSHFGVAETKMPDDGQKRTTIPCFTCATSEP